MRYIRCNYTRKAFNFFLSVSIYICVSVERHKHRERKGNRERETDTKAVGGLTTFQKIYIQVKIIIMNVILGVHELTSPFFIILKMNY